MHSSVPASVASVCTWPWASGRSLRAVMHSGRAKHVDTIRIKLRTPRHANTGAGVFPNTFETELRFVHHSTHPQATFLLLLYDGYSSVLANSSCDTRPIPRRNLGMCDPRSPTSNPYLPVPFYSSNSSHPDKRQRQYLAPRVYDFGQSQVSYTAVPKAVYV